MIPDGYTLKQAGNTAITLGFGRNSSFTISENASMDKSIDIDYLPGMKFAKWLCPYERVRTDEDLFAYPHGDDLTGEEYAKIYSTFTIKSIYYDSIDLSGRADLKAIKKTCTDNPITVGIMVIPLDDSVEYVEGYDYTLTYSNNILPGTASYTVTPIEGGRLIGDPVTVEFTIQPRKLIINKPAELYMQAGGNALDSLPETASAIYYLIDKTPQEIQNGKFTWYVDAERTTLLTNEYGAALEAGEYTVYWTYSHKHTGFKNDLTGESTLIVTEKAPQQIEIDGVGVIGDIIHLFSKEDATSTVNFDLSSVITVNGEPVTDFGALTWRVNGIAPVDGASTYVVGTQGSVSVDQNGHLNVVGMYTDTVIVTLTAAETESYAAGVGQITVNINAAGFRFHFEGSAGDSGGSGSSSGSSGPQKITISGVTVDHKIYDGQPVSYNGTPVATLSDGTPVALSGEYTFTYYKQTGSDDGDALDYTPCEVGNYWLIITYSDASYKGEYKTEFIIAHKELGVNPYGTLEYGALVNGHTIERITLDSETHAVTKVVIKDASENDVSSNYLVIFEENGSESAKIAAASVSLGTDLTIKYYVNIEGEELLASLDRFSMRFTMNGKTVTVALDETKKDSDGHYVFAFENIAPQCMGDNIKAELLLGENVIASVDEYSVLQNAKNLLEDHANDEKLVTLIKSMLNYGAAAQKYVNYKANALVNVGYEIEAIVPTALSA